jgi:hypothetical protein
MVEKHSRRRPPAVSGLVLAAARSVQLVWGRTEQSGAEKEAEWIGWDRKEDGLSRPMVI